MAVYTAGHVEVKVTPNLDGLQKTIAKFTGQMRDVKIKIDIDTAPAEKQLTRLERSREIALNVKLRLDKARAELDKFANGANNLSKNMGVLMARATAAAAAMVALGGTANMIGGLGAALAAASGAALLLPGAIGAGIAAAGALKLAFAGVGDALKAVAEGDAAKLDEAMKKLAPSAQGFVRTVSEMRSQFVDLQQSVQGAFFEGLAQPFREMATAVLPVLKSGLTGIASEFGNIAKSAMLFFTQKGVLNDLNTILTGTQGIVKNLGAGFTPFLRIFTTLAAVATPILEKLTAGFGGWAQNLAVLVDKAAASGQLTEWINSGVQAFKDLFGIIGNVGGIIGTVFGAANNNGATLFAILRDITGQVRAFLESSQGQELLNTIFTTLRQTIDALKPGIGALVGALLNIVTAIAPSLPAVGAAFSAIAIALAPVLTDLGQLVANVLPGLAAFVQQNAPLLVGLGLAIGGIGLAVKGVTLGMQIGSAVMKTWAAVTKTVTVAQKALNFVMKMNPIGLIIMAITALVAGLIWAYNNVGWFRDMVDTAFRWIGDVATWLWENAIKPAWDAIVAAFEWAWSVISPVLTFIWDALKFLGAIIAVVLVAPFVIAFNVISAAAIWLWENAIKPVLGWIADGWRLLMDGINWVWLNVLKPVWDAIQAAALWLWENVLLNAFRGIGVLWDGLINAMKWAWDYILKPVWDAISAAANWLWNNVMKPVFDAIGAGWRALMDGLNWVWQNILRPCFDAVKGAVDSVGRAFDTTVNWIRDVWNTIKGILAKPINFVIDTVYNNGIKKTWDTIAGWLKIPGLPHVAPIQEFATGGRVRNLTGGGKIPGSGNRDTVPGMLMPGEYVFSKKAVQNLGMNNLHAAHMSARSGVQQFARGGAVHTFPQMENIARSLGLRTTSALRPGDSGYHGKGQAIDIVPAGSNSAQRLFERFPNATQIISAQWRGGTGVLNGRPHFYAKDNADHWDHVHWAMTPEALAGGGGGGGGLFDIVGMVVNWFRNTLMKPVMDSAAGLLPKFGDNGFTSGIAKVPGRALDAGTDWVKTKANDLWQFIAGIFGGGDSGPGVGPVVDQVRAAAARFGWGDGAQWQALSRLIQKESSWNPNAQNPTSTAYGLFQFLNSTWGTVGGFKTGNAGQQAEFGLRYIRQRYGSPAGALDFHNRNNWYAKGGPVPSLYDNGGVLPPTPNGYSLYANHTGKPEAVLTNEQWSAISSAAQNGMGSGVTVNNNITPRVDASPEAIAQAVTRQAKRAFRGA